MKAIFITLIVLLVGCESPKQIPTQTRVQNLAPLPKKEDTKINYSQPSRNIVYETKIFSRIFCQKLGYPGLTTLRSDANDVQLFADIRIEENGNNLEGLFSPFVLATSTNTSDLVIQQKIDENVRVLRTQINIPYRHGNATEVYRFKFVGDWLGNLYSFGIQNSKILLSQEKQWFAAPTEDFKQYSLRDMNPGATLKTWKLDPNTSSPATFSPSGEMIAFYTREGRRPGEAIRLLVASYAEETFISFPAMNESSHQILPTFAGEQSLYWLESTNEKLYLRWARLNSPTTVKTVRELEGATPSYVLVRSFNRSSPEEKIYYFAKDAMNLIELNPITRQIISHKRFELPASYKELTQKIPSLSYLQLLYLPWSQQIFMSLNEIGGALSFELDGGYWSVSGFPIPANRCLNPVAGPEVLTIPVDNNKGVHP